MLRDGVSETSGEWCGSGGEASAEYGKPNHGERCDRLHRTLKRIVKARGSLDAQEAAALREAQALGIWRRYGYTSLLDYMEKEMGYTPRAALERLRVAHAIVELPQIAAQLEQGDLSFSGARELTRVATPETEGEWLGATKEMNLREVEEAVSGHKKGELPTDPPDPSLRRKVLRFEVCPETYVLMRQVQQAIEKEKGQRLDDDGIIEALCRTYLGGSTDAEHADCGGAADGAGATAVGRKDRPAYQVAVTVCESCNKGWQHGGGISVEMSPPAIERALCDATNIGSLVTAGAPRATDTIPKAIRRKVKHRDKGRCVVPGCRSSRNCDLHHLIARADGGMHHENNIITLCEAHHLAHHRGALTIKRVDGKLVFERAGANNFTRAERAVHTAAALQNLGWKKDAVRAAVERTKTHVGTEDLSLEQWIRIARGYCEKGA